MLDVDRFIDFETSFQARKDMISPRLSSSICLPTRALAWGLVEARSIRVESAEEMTITGIVGYLV